MKLIVQLLLLFGLLFFSNSQSCSNNPALQMIQNMAANFSSNSTVAAIIAEFTTNFPARTAAVPSNPGPEWGICPQFSTLSTCCTSATMNAINIVAQAFFFSNINYYAANNMQNALVINNNVFPDFNDMNRWGNIQGCLRQGAIKRFADFVGFIAQNGTIPPGGNASNGGQSMPPPSNFNPQQDIQNTFAADFKLEFSKFIFTRSQMCALCITPATASQFISNGKLKLDQTSFQNGMTNMKKACRVQSDEIMKILQLLGPFLGQALNPQSMNGMCGKIMQRMVGNQTFLQQADPCMGDRVNCNGCAMQVPGVLGTQNPPRMGSSLNGIPGQLPQTNPNMRLRRAQSQSGDGFQTSTDSNTVSSYTQVASDSNLAYGGVNGSPANDGTSGSSNNGMLIKLAYGIVIGLVTLLI